MEVVTVNWASEIPFEVKVVKDLKLTPILKETHPKYFIEGSALSYLGKSGLYGIENPN